MFNRKHNDENVFNNDNKLIVKKGGLYHFRYPPAPRFLLFYTQLDVDEKNVKYKSKNGYCMEIWGESYDYLKKVKMYENDYILALDSKPITCVFHSNPMSELSDWLFSDTRTKEYLYKVLYNEKIYYITKMFFSEYFILATK